MADEPTAPQDLIDELVGNAHGNAARVKEILSAHPELVNARARWGETPIQAAIIPHPNPLPHGGEGAGAQASFFLAGRRLG